MTARKSLPTIAPCPCTVPGCGRVVMPVGVGQFRVVAACGFAGPIKFTKRAARESWNRRSDAEAERRGALAAAKWFKDTGEYTLAKWLEEAIKRGEVLPAKGKRA